MVLERTINVIRPAEAPAAADSTDIALLVSTTSGQEIDPWDRRKIADSLVKEAGIDAQTADEISSAVEGRIDGTGRNGRAYQALRQG